MGDVPTADLRKRQAVRLLDRVVDSGRTGVARRAHWVVKRITRWSVLRDEIEVDLLAGLRCPAAKVCRDRVLTDDEFKLLWPAWCLLSA